MSHHQTWVPHLEYEREMRGKPKDEFKTFDEWLVEKLDRKMADELLTLAAVDGGRYIFKPRGT